MEGRVVSRVVRRERGLGARGSRAVGAWLVTMVVGCSGSSAPANTVGPSFDGGGFSGLSPCDAGSNPGPEVCGLSISFQGGVSGAYSTFNSCGTSGSSLSWNNIVGGHGVGFSITFMGLDPPVDQIGTFVLASANVTVVTQGAETRVWRSTGCSATVSGSVCSPTDVFHWRRVVTGSGTCTQPALPQLANMEAPVTIGDFTFLGFFNPRP